MAANRTKLGEISVEHFVVVDDIGVPVPSLVYPADFSASLLDPTGTDVIGLIPITLVETSVGGKYKVSFTPNALGRWSLSIFQATYAPDGYHGDWDVFEAATVDPSAVADEVWDRDTTSHDNSGTFGEAMSDVVKSAIAKKRTVTFVDVGAKASFKDNGIPEVAETYVNQFIAFTSGDNKGLVRKIADYQGPDWYIILDSPLPHEIEAGDSYLIKASAFLADATTVTAGGETTTSVKSSNSSPIVNL